MKLVIEIKDINEMQFVKQLLGKLHIEVYEEVESYPNQKIAFEALEKIANRGVLSSQIHDPIQWQRELRRDHDLPFRE